MQAARSFSHSAYLDASKQRPAGVAYNLASSGVLPLSLAELGVRWEDLELNGQPGYGYPPLQERLALWKGVTPDNVVAAIGTSMANHLAIAALVAPGDEVLVEEPAYEPLVIVPQYLGATVRRFERRADDGFRLDPEAVARAVTSRTRLIVLTNLHNPSSAFADEATLRAVGEVARSAGAHVLVDEVYLEARFDPPARSAFHLGEYFVATCSLTKAYGLGGLRCGWCLAGAELARRMWRLNNLFGNEPPHVAEQLSVGALDRLAPLAARARDLLDTNRRAAREALAGCAGLAEAVPDFGTTAFLRLPRGDADTFCTSLRERYETAAVPGRFFERPDFIRIGLGGEPAETAAGLARLVAALRDSRAS